MINVKRHCYEIYNEINNLDVQVEFKVISNPFLNVLGYLSPFSKNYKIVINVNPLKHLSEGKRKFYLYSTVYHEIEHIKMYEEPKKQDCINWESITHLLENISLLNAYNIKPDDIYFLTTSNRKIEKMLAKNYEVSSSELKSRLVGFIKAKEKINYNKEIENIIDAAKLVNENTEVIYDINGTLQDKYNYIIYETSKYISKYPEILNLYKVLTNFYDSNGNIKSIYELYKNRDENNKKVYDKLIIYLISTGYYNEYISNKEIRKYINKVITDYYNEKIEYIDKSVLTKIFISDENIIKQNIIVIQERIQSLILFLQKQKLERKVGTILIKKM